LAIELGSSRSRVWKPKRTGQLNKRSNEAGGGRERRRSPTPAGESWAYRERVDLVGAALLEGVVVPRPPRHASLPSPIDAFLLARSLPSFPLLRPRSAKRGRRT